MEAEKNKNNNLSLEEENILKQEIKFIQEEFKTKIEEHKKLKEELKKVKNSFHNGLKDYTTEKNSTIEKEREIESLLSKISKMRKMMFLSINQTINKKFYIHLSEISNNKQKEKILLKIFNFIFNIYNYSKIYLNSQKNEFCKNFDLLSKNMNINNVNNILNINNIQEESESIKELLIIIRGENEIRNILLYTYDIFHNLQEENIELYNNIKKSFYELFNEMSVFEKQYPFDFLLDFIKNIFCIIDYEKQVENLKVILNKLILEKNEKFIEIKNIESIIKIYNRNNKIISNYIKALKSFYYRIKEQNKINNDQNSNEKNNKNNIDIMKELIEDIEKFKKITIDYDKINSNLDAMTSLSFGTNYTLSEKSSIKSSIMDSKNNNDDIENETKSERNENNNENNNNINNNDNKTDKKDDKKKEFNKDLKKSIEPKNNNNIMITKINNQKKFKPNNKFQKKTVEKKVLLRNNNINKNNNYINQKNKKKNICLVNNKLNNLNTTDINIINKTHMKRAININNNSVANKKSLNKMENNNSYDKKNRNIVNKRQINNKKSIIKSNAQKILNQEMKKRFNSNNIKRDKIISPDLKPALNMKNKSQIYETKQNSNNLNKIKNKITEKEKLKDKEKENSNYNGQIIIEKNKVENNENSQENKERRKIFVVSDTITENEFENKPSLMSSNQRYDFQSNNRYNISKKIEQLKQKEQEESIEITIPNKENNANDNYFDTNNIKDSICDEMITQNFGTANSLIRSTTNDYINRLGFKNNVLWSENLYKNKAMKFKSNFKKLNIEKPIDTSSCCAACT